MKIIEKFRNMSTQELASFFHYDLTRSDCSNCILNCLNKMEFCNPEKECIKNIEDYLQAEDISK